MTEPVAAYYRWVPDLPDGMYTLPIHGELRPGRVVEVLPQHLYLVTGSQWKLASRQEYKEQPDIPIDRAELRSAERI
jgi:hypothetical protein